MNQLDRDFVPLFGPLLGLDKTENNDGKIVALFYPEKNAIFKLKNFPGELEEKTVQFPGSILINPNPQLAVKSFDSLFQKEKHKANLLPWTLVICCNETKDTWLQHSTNTRLYKKHMQLKQDIHELVVMTYNQLSRVCLVKFEQKIHEITKVPWHRIIVDVGQFKTLGSNFSKRVQWAKKIHATLLQNVKELQTNKTGLLQNLSKQSNNKKRKVAEIGKKTVHLAIIIISKMTFFVDSPYVLG